MTGEPANHRINSTTKTCSHSSEKASPCTPPSLTVMLTVARADTHAPPVKTSSSWSETSKTTGWSWCSGTVGVQPWLQESERVVKVDRAVRRTKRAHLGDHARTALRSVQCA